jgi:ribosome biogenesis protein Tsr3
MKEKFRRNSSSDELSTVLGRRLQKIALVAVVMKSRTSCKALLLYTWEISLSPGDKGIVRMEGYGSTEGESWECIRVTKEGVGEVVGEVTTS